MIDLSTKYLGLNLRNPIIVGSSGLTDSVEKIKNLEAKGAGAVVLKSIFEEEITLEYEHILKEAQEIGYHDENLDYFDVKIKQNNIANYLAMISNAKKSVKIPIIASINCLSSYEWIYFAKKMQDAGADAIELNMFVLPNNIEKTDNEIEKIYFDIADKVLKDVTIPISLKISPYFTNIGNMVKRLSEKGVAGFVLFNRFYNIDIDVDKKEITSANVLSNSSEHTMTLRWIAMLSKKVKCDFSASTGIHDGKSVVKQILAGASAVQMVSAFYKNGSSYIKNVLDEINVWMVENNYKSINDFKGIMSQSASNNPAMYERVQFMKYFGGHKE